MNPLAPTTHPPLLLSGSHVPRVRVPGIKWEATSRRVLTMEWIDGVKLTDEEGGRARGGGLWQHMCMRARVCGGLGTEGRQGGHHHHPCPHPHEQYRLCTAPAAMTRLGLDTVDFVTVGIECTLRQLLEAGFFHAGALPVPPVVPPAGSPHAWLLVVCWGPMLGCCGCRGCCVAVPCRHTRSPRGCRGAAVLRAAARCSARAVPTPPHPRAAAPVADPHPGNLLATTSGDLVYLDFGMMSEAPPSGEGARCFVCVCVPVS